MRVIIFSSFILFLIGCKQAGNDDKTESFKDSVVKRYLSGIDSLDYYDTTNEDYKMLKAYINDDTTYFKEFNRLRRLAEKELEEYPPLDTCVHLQKLSELPVHEAYRFSHSQSFCYSDQRITITRKNDTVRLHYVEFTMLDNNGSIKFIKNGKEVVIGPGCVVLKDFEKNLSMKDWEGLEARLYEADYWGLKPHRYDALLDGSFWQIEASQRNKWTFELEKTYSVWRHCGCSSAFKEIGRYLLKLSGEETMCGDFF